MWNVKNQHVFYYPGMGEREAFFLEGEKLLHQMRRVLRMSTGDTLVLLDGKGTRFLARIVGLEKKRVWCQVLDKDWKEPENPSWHLILGTPKKEALKEVLNMGTQLGARSFTLVDAEYSQVKSRRYEEKHSSLLPFIQEALEQSGRLYLPNWRSFSSWQDFRRAHQGNFENFFVADLPLQEPGESQTLANYGDFLKRTDVYLVVGPEGGWSPAERAQFQDWGGKFYSLSPYVLRLQTAAVASIVAAQTILGARNPRGPSNALGAQNRDCGLLK